MPVIKTREIKLLRPSNAWTEKITQSLANIDGVKEIKFDSKRGILAITYDLESIMLKRIEEMLEAQGIQLDNSFLRRMKRSWHHFTEQNELDNLHVQPSCCADPKETLGKAKHH